MAAKPADRLDAACAPERSEQDEERGPTYSRLLAYAAMLPIALAALGALLTDRLVLAAMTDGLIVWSAAILLFFAGVERGLSFRQPGGAHGRQIGVSLGLFFVGTVALGTLAYPRIALVLLLLGFAALVWLDPVAARHDEAPRYFARLRPVQLMIPIASLLAVLVRIS